MTNEKTIVWLEQLVDASQSDGGWEGSIPTDNLNNALRGQAPALLADARRKNELEEEINKVLGACGMRIESTTPARDIPGLLDAWAQGPGGQPHMKLEADKMLLEAEVAELRELLSHREWQWDGDEHRYFCRECSARQRDGHMQDCRMAAALAKEPPARRGDPHCTHTYDTENCQIHDNELEFACPGLSRCDEGQAKEPPAQAPTGDIKTLVDDIAAIGVSVPDLEWAKVPDDLSMTHHERGERTDNA